jgi:hypothetical protein
MVSLPLIVISNKWSHTSTSISRMILTPWARTLHLRGRSHITLSGSPQSRAFLHTPLKIKCFRSKDRNSPTAAGSSTKSLTFSCLQFFVVWVFFKFFKIMDFIMRFSYMYAMYFDHFHPILLSCLPPLPSTAFPTVHFLPACLCFWFLMLILHMIENVIFVFLSSVWGFFFSWKLIHSRECFVFCSAF